ncbi:MAG: tRNA (adenosine(37)-N6)-threonylcarbamoyltransferase complex transferase subunit TsaD [Candidatus Saccharibacteria bacterium]|nr:tRNA (adenosine(37)-N6)-threonylcarbamoyltransferase complex transferase subunit TsaD [Candidatus Saccharibacteria bacterium]
MKILGIESSCDETAAAVIEDGRHIISSVVQSQIDIHAQYGGVVPEVAARSHLEVINPVVTQALHDGNLTWEDIDAIAVTYAPGLSGSLLIGTLTAKTLAYLHRKPLYPIHHVEAHVYANFLTSGTGLLGDNLPPEQPRFPLLALIVSGGHTQLVFFRDHGDFTLLGQTQDDAVGEAFDKVAKIIGLAYPGGPSIAKVALAGDPQRYPLPKAKLAEPYNFSFSGLKTAVLRAVQHEAGVDFTFPSHQLPALLTESQRHDFAASFQRVAIETLVDKTVKAYAEYQPASVVIAGGVAANQELRRQLQVRLPHPIHYAPIWLCTDNAAMIATLAYHQAQHTQPIDPLTLDIEPSRTMTPTKQP